jgi:hypothetical protein
MATPGSIPAEICSDALAEGKLNRSSAFAARRPDDTSGILCREHCTQNHD